MSYINLRMIFELHDAIDYSEGLIAYENYNKMMHAIAAKYGVPVNRIVAAFVALSPQNDYLGNLRSLISLLEADDPLKATVSSFGHCKQRAITYLDGTVDFLATVRGLKIRSFYFNIMEPDNSKYVTIDGHMSAAWQGKSLTMAEALVKSKRQYERIAQDCRYLARTKRLRPNQVQAIIWFTRKRLHDIKYAQQLDIFYQGNQWRNNYPLDEIRPFRNVL